MSRCEARVAPSGRQCRRQARAGRVTCLQHDRADGTDRADQTAGSQRPASRAGRPSSSLGPAARPAETVAPAGQPEAFYTSALDAAEQYNLAAAASVSGIDGEIAVLRLIIRRELQAHPDDAARLLKGLEALTRAVRVKYQLSEKRRENLAEAMAAVLEELGTAAGLGAEE